MNGRMTAAEATPRPGFSDELLSKLAQDVDHRPGAALKVAAGALGGAAVALLLAGRKRTRR